MLSYLLFPIYYLYLFSFFTFLLLFKYSVLHFPPTPPKPSHPHVPPLILPPFGFVPVSFIDVPENPPPFYYLHLYLHLFLYLHLYLYTISMQGFCFSKTLYWISLCGWLGSYGGWILPYWPLASCLKNVMLTYWCKQRTEICLKVWICPLKLLTST